MAEGDETSAQSPTVGVALRLVEGRRLTGPSLWADGPAAAVTLHAEGVSDTAIDRARAHFASIVGVAARALGWPAPVVRCQRTGPLEVWTATAPIDRLYAAVELAERAAERACSSQGDATTAPDADADAVAVQAAIGSAQTAADVQGDPALLALAAAAQSHQAPLLTDDDEVSLGWGVRSQRWPRGAVPAPAQVDWARLGAIPTAIVTGTNGKTTTTRLLARIGRAAGLRVGATSTDGLAVDGALVERGDWTGPGGARALLRNPTIELAVLETARGGLLRRGLAVCGVDAAAVTNVSDDHLGEWGIDSVEAMAYAKLLVARALRPGGVLVVGDDVAHGAALHDALRRYPLPADVRVWRFCADGDGFADGPGDIVARCVDDVLQLAPAAVVASPGAAPAAQRRDAPAAPLRIPCAAVPITLGGAARHNVANALAAALLARALGLPDDAIVAGLGAFAPTPDDSPGRSNLLTVGGARVILDFGHNPDGLRHLAVMAGRLPAARRLVVLGQAGDRSDAAISGMVSALLACRPDHWILKDMPHYDRGRARGEVIGVLRRALAAAGVAEGAVTVCASEGAATAAALAMVKLGDLLLLLAHEDPQGVLAQVRAAGGQVGWT